MRISLLTLIFFALTGALNAQPANDNFASSIDITGIINTCSPDAAYTTIAGTSDLNAATCWNTPGGVPLSNVWFHFTAPASGQINVTVDIGGIKGTHRRTQLALWQSNGTTQIKCNRYVNDGDDVSLGATSLTPGNTYYISVDAQSAGYVGTFTLCLSNAVDYDYYEGAIDITALINTCSADALYNTTGATSDKNPGSCWNTAGGTTLYNRWFRFTAPASGMINITADIGGAKGTGRRSQLALWQADGTTQVKCNRYINDGDDVVVGATTLTPGNTYYLSVDVQNAGYYGTFTLCLSNAVDYDYYEGAIDITALINTCSADALYNTTGATSDKNPGSCWNTAGGTTLYNRWFRFTAPASGMINITADIGGAKGTGRRSQLALWQADGTTQVKCNRYINDGDDVVVGATTLTPGNTYYLSVDVQNAGYYGTFTLCLSNAVDYDYYEGAIDITALINTCSADALYNTTGATSDKNPGSCWNTAGGTTLYNRWFRFTAPASGMINITADIGGAKGTGRRSQLALWQADGTTQVKCNRYINDGDDVVVGATTLTPGNTYYLSVDVQNAGYYGTFTLCLSNAVDYDYYEGAIDITALINTCSADALYNTTGATSDKNPGSCWNTAGGTTLYNRWFRFTAPASGMINITADIGGAKGTGRRSQLALWQADGTTQVKCNRYINDGDDVVVGATTLTPGNTYYLSVDVQNAGYYGTFTLCLSNAVDYDYYEGAIDITALINTCSADALYNTTGATSDKNPGSCWNTAGGTTLYNRWFRFTAPASGMINITADIGGAKGTGRRSQLALWQADGTTQVKCNRYINDGDDVVVGATTLTPGNTYHLSVDVQNAGYYGTFTLCLSNAVDYDYYEGAIDITALINTCSADALYNTTGATSDKNPGSCWNTAGGTTLYNRWFRFTAPASGMINITADIGGAKGTGRRSQLALWQADGTTQVKCNRYINDGDDVVVGATTLTPGNTYYLSVDVQNAGYYGTFTLCLSSVVDYDYYEGAIDITDTNNWCSSDALYTTIGATSDKNPGSCWNTAGGVTLFNRWFRFTAPALGLINITVDVGGTKGTQRRTQIALWQSDGTTPVKCNRYTNDGDDVVLGATGLTPGNTYYFSVDVQNAGYYGTFSLCVDNAPDYDFYEGAYDITNLNNWCSSDAVFTTIGATSDKSPGSCWNTAGGVTLYNRWFKFQAISASATILVDIGGAKGTQRRTQLALWESDGVTQVACQRYVADGDDVSISPAGLVPGNTYYISVDVQNAGYYGTFTLCVNNIGTTFYSRANGAWNSATTWSTVGYGGVAAATFPNAGDVANIQDNDITVSGARQAAEVNLNISAANTSLTVNASGSLIVNGRMTMTNSGNNFTGSVVLLVSSTVYINDALTLTRGGGNQAFGITMSNGSALTVNQDFSWSSTAGTAVDNILSVSGTGSVTVNRDLLLTSTGGRLINLQFINTSVLTIKRDVTFTATAAGQERINLSNTAQVNIGRNFVRGGTPFGSLTCAGSSTVQYNGDTYLQTFAGDAGSGGDSFTYQNVTINNTRSTIPQITMGGSATVNGNLTMTAGIISSTSGNILNLKNTSSTTIGSTASYVSGPMTYEVASAIANTVRNLPIGKGSDYRPAVLTVTHSSAALVIYTAEHFSSSAAALGYTLPATVDKVSGVRYWQIDRTAVANFTSANVRLHYGIGTSDGVTDFTNLTVVKNIGAGTTWFDIGGTATGNGSGSILSGNFTTFSIMTLGNLNGGLNPLPVELESFTGKYENGVVKLNWATASELNNDYFEIQRASNGFDFSELYRVQGAGTTTERTEYTFEDESPLPEKNYYRLKQADLDGQFTYSKIILVLTETRSVSLATVFPNPSQRFDQVSVHLDNAGPYAPVEITISNLNGRKVASFRGELDENGNLIIPAVISGALTESLYLVSIKSQVGVMVTKWVVH